MDFRPLQKAPERRNGVVSVRHVIRAAGDHDTHTPVSRRHTRPALR